MKRSFKIIGGGILLLAVFATAFCVLCPVLFPERMKASSHAYEGWWRTNQPARN